MFLSHAGCTLAKLSCVPDPAVLSSIILPVIVNREQWNCISGNVINLLGLMSLLCEKVGIELKELMGRIAEFFLEADYLSLQRD